MTAGILHQEPHPISDSRRLWSLWEIMKLFNVGALVHLQSFYASWTNFVLSKHPFSVLKLFPDQRELMLNRTREFIDPKGRRSSNLFR
jgi:hypothetical protein